MAKEGKRQSPVDIATESCETDAALSKTPLKWSYDPDKIKDIENTGASWKVNVDGFGSCECQNTYVHVRTYAHGEVTEVTEVAEWLKQGVRT